MVTQHHHGDHAEHAHQSHDHSAMIADFRHRFWLSLVLTVPILALSPARRFSGNSLR